MTRARMCVCVCVCARTGAHSYLERKPEGASKTKASFSEALSGDWAGEDEADKQGHCLARAKPKGGSKQTEAPPAWPPFCYVIQGLTD
jgi:hypothetical protein